MKSDSFENKPPIKSFFALADYYTGNFSQSELEYDFTQVHEESWKEGYAKGRASMLEEIKNRIPSEIEISRESGRKGMILDWFLKKHLRVKSCQ
jgi:hypothetical protein